MRLSYEDISMFIEILNLLVSFGSTLIKILNLIITLGKVLTVLLDFLNTRNNQK